MNSDMAPNIAVLAIVLVVLVVVWAISWICAVRCPRCHAKKIRVCDRWENGEVWQCGKCRYLWIAQLAGRR